MILTRARYLLHPLLLIMPQCSSPCQASVFLCISPSDSLPALIDNSKSSLGYLWFLGTQTFSKNFSCSKIESTFVMTPHGFKGLIPQAGYLSFEETFAAYSRLTSLERDHRFGMKCLL